MESTRGTQLAQDVDDTDGLGMVLLQSHLSRLPLGVCKPNVTDEERGAWQDGALECIWQILTVSKATLRADAYQSYPVQEALVPQCSLRGSSMVGLVHMRQAASNSQPQPKLHTPHPIGGACFVVGPKMKQQHRVLAFRVRRWLQLGFISHPWKDNWYKRFCIAQAG